MNQTLMVFFGVIIAFLMIAAISIAGGRRRHEEEVRRELEENWGRKGRYRFTRRQLESIARILDDTNGGRPTVYDVDDVTWHDLDMDRLYRDINTTRSSCGDCLLYERLRRPSFSEAELKAFDETAVWFDENEALRRRVQLILSEVGRDEDLSVAEALSGLENGHPVGGSRFVIPALLTLADLIFFFFCPLYAVLLFIPLSAVNIVLFLKLKDTTEDVLTGFRAILRMMTAVDELETLERILKGKNRTDRVTACIRRLVKARDELSAFRRGAFLVTGRNVYAEGPGQAILQYIKLFFHVDLIKFDAMLRELALHKEEPVTLMRELGYLDTACAVASYRRTLPVWCRPSFSKEETASLTVEGMVHPLINAPVENSAILEGGNLITGSNASGKSTFLRNTAICAVMAEALSTVPARRYEASYFRVMSSMALADNLKGGESYYVVEIRSLKRILDAAKTEVPILTLVDEVLRGTNTIERIAASAQILRSLPRPHVVSLAATHDIELTFMLEGLYRNYHFEERMGEEDVVFDYRLKEGRASTRNAIRLLKSFDYDETVIEKAVASAAHFEETGEWKL
ncbi:MAG: DNA mismatch repair protein MutS [Lachnospiraceae bacterium]|nr:DNA mismatch repair protein MutS [Lachnospiraceae bacterium]